MATEEVNSPKKYNSQILYSLGLLGAGAIIGWTFGIYGSGEQPRSQEKPEVHRRAEIKELRMGLPLEHNPTNLRFVNAEGRSSLEMRFKPNYPMALRERYEKVRVEFELDGKTFGGTYKTSDISPGQMHMFALPLMEKPPLLPQTIWGIEDDGDEELLYKDKVPKPLRD